MSNEPEYCPNGHAMSGHNRPLNASRSTAWACNACRRAFAAANTASSRGRPMDEEQIKGLANRNFSRIATSADLEVFVDSDGRMSMLSPETTR